MIEGHGDDLYRYGNKIELNFSTNIMATPLDKRLIEQICRSIPSISSYPEPAPFTLEREIAGHFGIAQESVMATSGAVEAIYLIAEMMAGAQSCIVEPTFSEYRSAAVRFSHTIRHIATIDAINPSDSLVWICNPNNPDGHVTDRLHLLSIIDSHPATTFIVDQAYAPYTLLPVLTNDDAVHRHNLLLLSSLTKRFSVPGLRIGYIVGAPDITSRVRRLRTPWSVNAIAIEAARWLIANKHLFPVDAAKLHNEALRLTHEFRAIGIEVAPTDCNFILCRLPFATAAKLKSYLIDNFGILIRDASNFPTLTPAHFRVAAQTAQANDQLISAMNRWITQHS